MIWSRRGLLGSSGAAAACAAFPAILRAQQPEPLATTAHGRLRGARELGTCVFRGVPYGGSVSGPEHRFRAAPPPPSWTGVRNATVYGAPSIQASGGPRGGTAPAEDCLFLNIWTPEADGAKRPVMFYSHGGGFTSGSGNSPLQNGANLAREQDVVVVQSNHRLGALGYLYLGGLLGAEYQGNQGLTDLAAALKWVSENIAAFGGDPHNVMIFGESGGGGKTSCLYAMPSVTPYFHKASIESPIGPGDRTADQATEIARDAMRALGLTDPRQLLSVPAADLLRFQTGQALAPGTAPRPGPGANRDILFWPFIDGRILPERPFKSGAPAISARKPLIVGGCKDEAVFFNMGDRAAFTMSEADLHTRLAISLGDRADAWIAAFRASRPQASPSQLYMAISTAKPWRAHAIHIAEEKARQGTAPVYSYILAYESPNTIPGTDYPLGSPHASDINTKFDNVGLPPGMPAQPAAPGGGGMFGDASAGKKQTAKNMSTLWANFARTGRPSAPGQPAWAPYTLARRETMLIDAQCRVVADPESAERRFWETQPGADRMA